MSKYIKMIFFNLNQAYRGIRPLNRIDIYIYIFKFLNLTY
jgi:hypothetical protein